MINVDSDNSKLFDLKIDDNPTILVVKANWCGHCNSLMPELDKLYQEMRRKDIDANIIKVDESALSKLQSKL